MANFVHTVPLLFSRQKYSHIDVFLTKNGFDKSNLNKVNANNVTPLTLALELNEEILVQDLLVLGANPLLVNVHGYTPLMLAKKNSKILSIMRNAIQKYTCTEIRGEVGAIFVRFRNPYRVSRVIKGGSNCIKVIEVENLITRAKSILKIKQFFNGLELRNYIRLHKYVDLFALKRFSLDDKVYENVYALEQKLVPGQKLSVAIASQPDQEAKDRIIIQAIIALSDLHKKRLVHRDPLPNNCHWDPETNMAEFVDYDIMRSAVDLTESQFKRAVLYDYRRLLLGCITRTFSHIKGLRDYTNNIEAIINSIAHEHIDPALKTRIHFELSVGLKSLANRDRAQQRSLRFI